VFEWLGVERVFGVQALNRLAPTLGNDQETAQKIQTFSEACAQVRASRAARQGEDEAKKMGAYCTHAVTEAERERERGEKGRKAN
jgi:hypothetical protein